MNYVILPFSSYSVSSLGAAEENYSRKTRLTLDLSTPYQSFSITNLINKTSTTCGLSKIDKAIDSVMKYGKTLGYVSTMFSKH